MTADPSEDLNGERVPKVIGMPSLNRGNVINTLESDPGT